MLTKKDFKAVAEIIKVANIGHLNSHGRPTACKFAIDGITRKLADYFATQNLRFDRERFMKACGLE